MFCNHARGCQRQAAVSIRRHSRRRKSLAAALAPVHARVNVCARSSTASIGCADAAGKPTAATCGTMLERLDGEGCSRFVVTDITKDGTLGDPNLGAGRCCRRTDAPVIASGCVQPR